MVASRKCCGGCERVLELTVENFYRHKKSSTGFQYICIKCQLRNQRVARTKIAPEPELTLGDASKITLREGDACTIKQRTNFLKPIFKGQVIQETKDLIIVSNGNYNQSYRKIDLITKEEYSIM